jgi:Xaa-Pro aminopeptidase
MSNNINSRVNQLRQNLAPDQILLVLEPANITYLAGFNSLLQKKRDAYLVISLKNAVLLHDSFMEYQPTASISSHLGSSIKDLLKVLLNFLKELNTKKATLLINKANLTVKEFEQLKTLKGFKIASTPNNLLLEQRLIKDHHQKKLITHASKIASRVTKKALSKLAVGMSELELKKIIEIELLKTGSQQPAFPVIVAFGKNSALPHHHPDNTKLRLNTPVLIDLGAMVGGYLSDMTRTVWFGSKPTNKFLEIEKVVKKAYQQTFNKLVNARHSDKNIKAQDLDHTARTLIMQAGYSQNFIHTTGHGIGLDIHESLSLNSANSQELKANMVITIEPGIYLPNQFGYRFENTILIQQAGATELTC